MKMLIRRCLDIKEIVMTRGIVRMTKFFSPELGVDIKVPIRIEIVRHDDTESIDVLIEKQSYNVGKEFLWAEPIWGE